MKNIPYKTKSGMQIGRLYTPTPSPHHDRDAMTPTKHGKKPCCPCNQDEHACHTCPPPPPVNVQLMEILGLPHVLGTAQTASIFLRAGVPPKVIVTQTSLPMHSDGFGNLATHDMEYEVVAIGNAKATTKIIDWATTRVMDYIDDTADIEIAGMAYDHAERDREFFREMDEAHAAIRRQFSLKGWNQWAV